MVKVLKNAEHKGIEIYFDNIPNNDIMQKLNLKPSNRVGEILQMLFDKVIDEEVENERNILLDLAVELNDTCN